MAKTIADEIAKVASAYIAEKMKQDPPTIIQSGYDDGGAVSPNIGKNTVIGAFAGAFLSIAVIVVSYLFNDTIIDTEDVEKRSLACTFLVHFRLMRRRMMASMERVENIAEAATERKEKRNRLQHKEACIRRWADGISKIWQAKRTKLYDEGIASSFEDKYTVLRG
ncbi:MAG: hypothetical protein ACLRI8_12065 [Agathobacter rectalis]